MKIKIPAAAIIAVLALGMSHGTLRAQAPAAAPQEPAPSDSRSVWDGVYTDEQARRGEALYQKECSACHGDTLNGAGEAPALSGGTFLSHWDGLTVGDLFDRTRKTMPQQKPGRLSREKNADILAYLLSFNKFPAGKTELQHQTEWLKEIRFEASKPESRNPGPKNPEPKDNKR